MAIKKCKKTIIFILCAAVLLLLALGVCANDTVTADQGTTPPSEESTGTTSPSGENTAVAPQNGGSFGSGRPNRGNMQAPEGMQFPENSDFTMPEGFDGFGFQGPSDSFNMTQGGSLGLQGEQTTAGFDLMTFLNEYQTPITAIVLLALAFVFVKLYRRKNY